MVQSVKVFQNTLCIWEHKNQKISVGLNIIKMICDIHPEKGYFKLHVETRSSTVPMKRKLEQEKRLQKTVKQKI